MSSVRKIAVLFVHGVETDDPDYAVTAKRRLSDLFTKNPEVRAQGLESALVLGTVYWSDVMRTPERSLLHATMGPSYTRLFDTLKWLVTRINAGSQAAVVPFGLAAAVRSFPFLGPLNFPVLRWLITDFLGDAVAYQTSPGERRLYDAVHGAFAQELSRVATEAGPDAPLCVIGHSLGTLIASNYFWDLQAEAKDGRRRIARAVRTHMGATPLEHGETLTHFFTLGSPLALWAMRFPEFGTPIAVPAPELTRHHPNLSGSWINFYEADDVVAYPLRPLGPKYAQAVSKDYPVRLGGLLSSWNPLSHPWYWNDPRVLSPIADALVDTAMHLNQDAFRSPVVHHSA